MRQILSSEVKGNSFAEKFLSFLFPKLRRSICMILDPLKRTFEYVYGPKVYEDRRSNHYQFQIPSLMEFTAVKINSLYGIPINT